MTDTTISPGLADSEGESKSTFDEEDPDYELEIELPDRTISMDVVDGESVALTLPDGRAIAQLTVTEHDGL